MSTENLNDKPDGSSALAPASCSVSVGQRFVWTKPERGRRKRGQSLIAVVINDLGPGVEVEIDGIPGLVDKSELLTCKECGEPEAESPNDKR